jgi:hypothetical protein
MRFSEWLDELRHNLGYAARTLRRNPGYAIVAVLTMLIGIGANSAIFTVTDAVMLRPLPYKNPGELVMLYEHKTLDGNLRSQMSPADLVDYSAEQRTLTGVGSIATTGLVFQPRDGMPSSIDAVRVSANVLDIVGTRPVIGRLFLAGEDAPDRKFVTILS